MSAGDERDASGREVLRSLWEHHWWSLEQFFAEARRMSAEEFGRSLDISYGSFHGALAHLVGAEMVWLSRVVRGESMTTVPDAAHLPTLDAVEHEWQRCMEGWRGVLDADDLNRVVRYTNTKGTEFQDPLWRIMSHLVDHSATYRGVLIAALRLHGRTPPVTGLMIYTRQRRDDG